MADKENSHILKDLMAEFAIYEYVLEQSYQQIDMHFYQNLLLHIGLVKPK